MKVKNVSELGWDLDVPALRALVPFGETVDISHLTPGQQDGLLISPTLWEAADNPAKHRYKELTITEADAVEPDPVADDAAPAPAAKTKEK